MKNHLLSLRVLSLVFLIAFLCSSSHAFYSRMDLERREVQIEGADHIIRKADKILMYNYINDQRVLTGVLTPIDDNLVASIPITLEDGFTVLSLRNVGVGAVRFQDGKKKLTLVYDVFWKGRMGVNGTLHVMNIISKEKMEANAQRVTLAMDGVPSVGLYFNYMTISDSTTEQHLDLLRGLEKFARKIHYHAFKAFVTGDQQVNRETEAMLKRDVNPEAGMALIGQLLANFVERVLAPGEEKSGVMLY